MDSEAAFGDTWLHVDDALRCGIRGLPGGSSLAHLLFVHRGVRSIGKNLQKHSLTNLYNERPTWLALVHKKLDAAVAASSERAGQLTATLGSRQFLDNPMCRLGLQD